MDSKRCLLCKQGTLAWHCELPRSGVVRYCTCIRQQQLDYPTVCQPFRWNLYSIKKWIWDLVVMESSIIPICKASDRQILVYYPYLSVVLACRWYCDLLLAGIRYLDVESYWITCRIADLFHFIECHHIHHISSVWIDVLDEHDPVHRRQF